MKLVKYITLTIIVLIINSCTFYSLKGTIPVHIKNIYISPIINKSMDQEVADLLDDTLNQLTIDQNVLEVVNYDAADSKLDIIVTEVSDIPYTLSQGNQFEKVDEWKFLIKANVIWSDYHKGEVLFNININEWGIYGDSIDISNDGIDNDGDGFIDSEDSDEVGAPRDAAKKIAINKVAEKISTKIISTW
ncbi:MAG: hypothetical protein CBD26_03170 [Candidatus Pelagibacter sp. TMED166]|nr:MAG: hypothetical protein CBD26_03170 [Candidatus Pelagibacter sp. TMED166]|tara:strand:- start:5300 stop:5869 length:570 start_codon:yes stop_codon:yes gene_type:complete